MLKRIGVRKLSIIFCSFIIVFLVYLFPDNERLNVKEEVIDNSFVFGKVFLLNDNNYVSLVNINLDNENKYKDSVNKLIIGNKSIPDNYIGLIPKGSKINSIIIKDNICTLDLLINKDKISNEEKMIEGIVYTLTSFNNIEKVKLLYNGNLIGEYDRSMGINKEYDITSLKDMNMTTVYYLNSDDNVNSYIPVSKVKNEVGDKVEIIIEELKSSTSLNSSLSSYLDKDTELEKYELEEKVMKLSFNDKIFDSIDSENILEEVKYTLLYSLSDNYNINKLMFYVNNEKVDEISK